MVRKALLVFMVLMLGCLHLHAQLATVSGTVVAAADGQRIAGASVSDEGRTVAVVTNDDGYFVLKMDSLPRAIVVSHLGYRTQRVLLSAGTSGLTVRLRPASVQLSELLVVADDPRQLVQKAIGRITHNYPRQPELYHCFYRETAMKRQHFITVAEGVLDMYKSAYGRGMGRDRVAIRKGRRLLSPKRSDTLSVKVLGGPMGAVILDMVKNPDFLLNDEDLDNYDMKMEAPQVIGDRQQYVVSIMPRRQLHYALHTGRLYIDRQTLAFTRIELSLDMSDREKATRAILVRKPLGVRFRPREVTFLVDYHTDGDVWRLSYVRTQFRFNCDWRRRLLATSFTATCEMVVTSMADAQGVQPIRGRDSFDQRDAFFDKVEYFRDPDFWQDYNIIEPTETLDKAIERIVRKY